MDAAAPAQPEGTPPQAPDVSFQPAQPAQSPQPYQLGYAVHPAPDDGSSVDADMLPASPAEAGQHFLQRDWDVAKTAYAAARYTGSIGGNDLALSDAIDARNDDVFRQTGVKLENPMAGGYEAEGAQRVAAAGGSLIYDDRGVAVEAQVRPYRLDAYQAALDQVTRDHPQIAPMVAKPLTAVRDDLINASERRAAIAAGRDGALSIIPQIAGGFAASLRDPVQLALMAVPVGGELKAASTLGSLTLHALHAAAINAGIQAVQEPMLQANRAERGVSHGFGEAAREIGGAALFGAGFGAAAHMVGMGLHKLGRATHEAALAGDPAAVAAIADAVPPATAPELHAAHLDAALDRAVMEHRPGSDFPERADPQQLAAAVRDGVRFGEGRGPLPEIVPDREPSDLSNPVAVRDERLAGLSDRAAALVEQGAVTADVAQHIPALFPDPTDHAFLVDLLRQEGVTTQERARAVLTAEAQVRSHSEAVAQILGDGSQPANLEEPAASPDEPRSPRQAPADRQQSLLGFLRQKGGLQDSGGELAARDLHRVFPGLVNNRRGVPLDRAREMAAEAGYLGADTERAVSETSIDDLLTAIENHPVYSVHDQTKMGDAAAASARRTHERSVRAAIADVDVHLAAAGEATTDRELIAAAAERMVAHGEDIPTALHGAHEDALASEPNHDPDANDYPPGFFDGVSFAGEEAHRDGSPGDGDAQAANREARQPGGDAGTAGGAPGDDWNPFEPRGQLTSNDLLDRVPLADRADGGDLGFAHPADLAAAEAREAMLSRLVTECPF